MNCEDIKALLPDYCRLRADDDEAPMILLHLKGCPGCRAEEGDIRKAFGRIERDEPWKPDSYYWNNLSLRINERIYGGKEDRRPVAPYIRFTMPFAAAVTILILVLTAIKVPGPDGADGVLTSLKSMPAADLAEYYSVQSELSGMAQYEYEGAAQSGEAEDEILNEIVASDKNDLVSSYLDDDELLAIIDKEIEPAIVAALHK